MSAEMRWFRGRKPRAQTQTLPWDDLRHDAPGDIRRTAQKAWEDQTLPREAEPWWTVTAVDQDFSESVMLCLKPPDEVSKALLEQVEEDQELDEAHITLLYLGETKDLGGEDGHQRIRSACAGFSRTCGWSELSGHLGGYLVFHNGDEKVLAASWDIPTIERFVTGLGDALVANKVPIDAHTHGYTAHQTMGYYEADERVTLPDKLPLVPELIWFNEFYLAWGDEPWEPYNLSGDTWPT